ncbi:MAG TPA: hypothetical protein VLK25_13760 [Allosphingosinicella sp.]|nr:hypothetical protein [Allosphingosinicella sp.]
MPRLHPEPLLFCLAWFALALWGGSVSLWLGILLTVGMASVLMPVSAAIVTKREDWALERQVRWGILLVAALGVLLCRVLLAP